MRIRDQQMTPFEDAARQRFEAELLDHARDFAPELAAAAGEARLRSVVSAAVDRGERCGFTDRGPVRLFLEMLLSLGWGFDTDPLLPWAAAALAGASDQHARARRLHSASHDYFALVAGPDDRLTVAALRRAMQASPRTFQNAPGPIDARIHRLLRWTYPEKYEHAGAAAVAALLPVAAQTATQYGIADDVGRAVIAGTLFAFGHEVFSDPLYPWIPASLTSPGAEPPAIRLHRRLTLYFERMIAVLEQPA